jgi:3-oxoacyl-[acyl-carrier-protein] synthase III
MQPVYINSLGAYLPGPALDAEQAEQRLGLVGGRPSAAKKRVLRMNGIQTRHYALDEQGHPNHRNYEMASKAVRAALEASSLDAGRVDYLAAATTQSDLFVPGFASLVQGEAGIKRCDIASFQGVCASAVAALQAAYHALACGRHASAVVCGSDFPSRQFRAPLLEELDTWKTDGRVPLDVEFLRWMLSDGAGAAVLQNRPNANRLSLRIDWIDLKSHADTLQVCMYAGAEKNAEGRLTRTYGETPGYGEAVAQGLFALRQDLSLLDKIVPLGVAHYLELIESGKLSPDFDWFLCHYSSHVFKGQIVDLLAKSQATIPPEKWFTNLYEKGNTGAASILIMLEELWASGRLQPGQKILAQVPESGRFITSFIHLTVVGPAENSTAVDLSVSEVSLDPAPAAVQGSAPASFPPSSGREELLASVVRRLFGVWNDFELTLGTLPLIRRINAGTLALEDYRVLLLNLRQQVVDGSRWISKAGSNITAEYFELRSMYIKHSYDEHRDFQMLERNYVSAGGRREDILSHPKNIGSEAFSAYMFHQAGRENPFHLVGSVFIIEGLGRNLARKWGERIQKALQLPQECVSFLLYHGSNDEHHLQEMHEALALLPLDEKLADEIVRAAKVTARLYQLQLEEIGNY